MVAFTDPYLHKRQQENDPFRPCRAISPEKPLITTARENWKGSLPLDGSQAPVPATMLKYLQFFRPAPRHALPALRSATKKRADGPAPEYCNLATQQPL